MSKKVAINGFGRIGRNFFRTVVANYPDIEIVSINDLYETKYLAYSLKYDTVFGRFPGTVEVKEGALIVNGKEIPVTAERDPANLKHADNDVDVAIESTGFFLDREGAGKHLTAGAKKVLISAPAKDPDYTVVVGCNHEGLKDEHKIISNASCTTNCLAPVVKVLNENFGIVKGQMTTIHSYTGNQKPVDTAIKAAPIKLTRGRACAANILPTSTGAAKAIGLVFPELKGKLDGFAMRVPTPNGSVVDLKVNLEKEASAEEINAAMKKASENELKGILGYNEDPIVSSDIIGDSHSSIFSPMMTNVIGDLAGVLSWYDNEWGFSCRMADLITKYI